MVTPRRHPRRFALGFTLIELIVALALGSLVLLMAASTLRAAVASAGATTADAQRGLRSERVRTLLSSQIVWMHTNEDRTPRHFLGSADTFEIATFTSIAAPSRKTLTLARWRIAPDPSERGLFALEYRESAPVSGGAGVGEEEQRIDRLRRSPSSRADERDLTPPRLLLTGLRSLKFAYLAYQPGGDPSYTDEWKGEATPRALRVTMIDREGREDRWVIPVVVTF